MGRSNKKKLDDFMRGQELKRLQQLELQTQIAKDFVYAKSELAFKNDEYLLTEKVLKGTPEQLQSLLTAPIEGVSQLLINPYDYPEGLVVTPGLFDGRF